MRFSCLTAAGVRRAAISAEEESKALHRAVRVEYCCCFIRSVPVQSLLQGRSLQRRECSKRKRQ